MMQMGVTPRERPRAGAQLRLDGSCHKIRRVRGLGKSPAGIGKNVVPSLCCRRNASAVSLGCAPEEGAQSGWDSPVLCGGRTEGVGLALPGAELFERSGQRRKLAPERKLRNCMVLTNVQRQQTAKAWRKHGALCLLLCFLLVGTSGTKRPDVCRQPHDI